MLTSSRWRRPVIKFGTSTLTGGTENLSLGKLADLVEQVAELHASALQPIVVSSGAVAAGRQRLRTGGEQPDVSVKQVLAAVGQSRLMHLYDQFFDFHSITSAQVLLTQDDFSQRQRYLNARSTLLGLIERRVVPVINENDVVASEEIRVGDNDTLAGLVAGLVDADLLILVSDVPGLFTSHPEDEAAELLTEVGAVTRDVEGYVNDRSGGVGTGGMATKLASAKLATTSGTEVRIVDGGEPRVVLRVLAGEELGTRFVPRTNPLESRKRWILSTGPAGRLSVDSGARRALVEQGASLLPAGIVGVTGSFERGDPVIIQSQDGETLARGMVNYAAADIERVRGRRSTEIPQILGFGYGDYVVHRNDMVCLVSMEESPRAVRA